MNRFPKKIDKSKNDFKVHFINQEMIDKIHNIMLKKSRVKVHEMTERYLNELVGISIERIYTLHENLGIKMLPAR